MTPLELCRAHQMRLRMELQWFALHGELPDALAEELATVTKRVWRMTGEIDA